jgi:ribosomal protein L37AE/L43A
MYTRTCLPILLFVGALAFAGAAWGVTAPAKIAYVEGKVMILRKGASKPEPAQLGMSLFYGDQVKTLAGKCQVNITSSGILRLSPNTTVLFPAEPDDSNTISLKKMLIGKTVTNFRQLFMDEVFEVRTPSLVAGTMDGANVDGARVGLHSGDAEVQAAKRAEIERLRAEGNARLDAIRAALKQVEGKPISHACPACGSAGPHRGTAEGWECNCGATVVTFGNYPTGQGAYNEVKESYAARIAELEQSLR